MDHYPREPCCSRTAHELVEKTILIEQYLLPLLHHLDIPGGILADFKQRWRNATLVGKTREALETIARRHNILLPSGITDDELRTTILAREHP
jgi:hypothetical protein